MKTIPNYIINFDKRAALVVGTLMTLAIFLTVATPKAAAQVSVNGGVHVVDLIAGQSIDAGDVSVEVVSDTLVVSFETMDGWELTEAHLWVGSDLANMPQTKKGNPRIGNFPYSSGGISGATYHEFLIPLSQLGGADYESTLCDQTFFIAAHAAVRLPDGSGGFQTETGWGSGKPLVERGSWAMYFGFDFNCGDVEPPKNGNCETAFSFGDKKLWDIIDNSTGDPITNRWGWQLTLASGASGVQPIYAGAGQNDTDKGTWVGNLRYDYNGSSVTVVFEMFDGFLMEETHLFVGSTEIQTAAPGQFGYLNDLDDATSDTYTIEVTGDPIYIVAHAVVCW